MQVDNFFSCEGGAVQQAAEFLQTHKEHRDLTSLDANGKSNIVKSSVAARASETPGRAGRLTLRAFYLCGLCIIILEIGIDITVAVTLFSDFFFFGFYCAILE